MNVPEELQYTTSHEWVRIEGDIATIGITDHAQNELGDIVDIELPDVGDALKVWDSFGDIDSVKAANELYTPVGGEVVEINEALLNKENLSKINEEPYGDGWMIKIRIAEEGDLLSAKDYERLLEESE